MTVFLLLASCGGGGGGNPPAPQPANQAPSFTSATAATVRENVVDAYIAGAADPNGDAVTFAISGGVDAARFSIQPGGQLRFLAAPNFEAPADSDSDNVYLVEVSASDGRLAARQTVQIAVANDREGIQVRRIATGFNQPVFVAPVPGENRVFVLEKGGNIFLLDLASGSRVLFLSAAERLNPAGAGIFDNISTDGERGLLGLAAAPDYQASGRFVLFVTNAGGDIEIRLCRRASNGLGAAGRCQVLFTIEHSRFNNHNGGWMAFGPDGNLYIATGDGGGAGDPLNNAQNPHSLLGKILRIVINPDPFAGASPVFYFPAPGNPFLAGGGAREVFALGLRNPFRASFHNANLIIGDVGQNMIEEIDLLRPQDGGANFGWPFREGTRAFAGTAPAGLVGPVTEYPHGTGPREGRTVIGGYVYRGPVASLAQNYVFADFISGNIWTVPASRLEPGQVLAAAAYERRNEDFTPDFGALNEIVSFGEDSAGNLYIVDFDGELFLVGAA
ncbi:MAG TPA: PQQ-dependent sugar dehydrogenase [Allosphingosinicella sp.]|nr:PQQ-dependent sugar dehydrogenase [Allosphingosinicella sp.]